MHYLDHAATTAVLPEAAAIACRVMTEQFGNPSSVHRMGIEASGILETARKQVAAILSAAPSEVTFTSCGYVRRTTIWDSLFQRYMKNFMEKLYVIIYSNIWRVWYTREVKELGNKG